MGTENNRVLIKRNWRGKIVEIELVVKKEDPDRKPVLELLEVTNSIFAGGREE